MDPDEGARALAASLSLHFEDIDLLQRALTHPSWCAEHGGEDYQRLEFLGDSVLGYVVAQLLYRRFPQMHEGDLTRMKNALVRGRVLAEVAGDIGAVDAIRLGEGSNRTGVRGRPSVREAVFEAIVGAVYLDQGMDAAEAFVERALGARIDCDALLAATDDPKTHLQEVVQARGLGLPVYRIVSREGPAHAPTFTAEVSIGDRLTGAGAGPSKQAAEQAAAGDALGRFESQERRQPGRPRHP